MPPAQLNRFHTPSLFFGGGFILLASDRDDALVVVEEGEVSPGITALAWLAMIKVRTQQLDVMNELVVERECHDVVSRLSIGSGRNRRKAQAWRRAECQPVPGLDTGPTGIRERHVRHALRRAPTP